MWFHHELINQRYNTALKGLAVSDKITGPYQYVRVFANRYMEAPAIFKKDGKCYIIASDCTGWDPNAARSAVADNIFGPYTELGNPCIGEGAEITFNSQSTYVLPVAGKKSHPYYGW